MTKATDSEVDEGVDLDALKTAKTPRALPKAMEKYQFKKGQSGNPSGVSKDGNTIRRRKFKDRISKKTRGGDIIVDTLVSIMKNEVFDKQNKRGTKAARKQVSIKDRLQAAKLLAEFGFGKPAPQIQVPTNTPSALDAGPKVVILQLTPQEVVDGGLEREAEVIEGSFSECEVPSPAPGEAVDGGSCSVQVPAESLPTEHLASDGLGVSEGDRPVAPEGGEGQDGV
jgi:hypothetical protein|tara:strand:+ start:560 stop:1237 length:678 start_codon:yes stop_codon:yes gene_type:complete